MKNTRNAYIIFLFALVGIMVASASVYVFHADALVDTQAAPPDTIPQQVDLKYPLPQSNPNPFVDKNQQATGVRLQESPEYTYKVTFNEESGEYEIVKMLGDMPIGSPYSMTSKEYFDFSAAQRRDEYWRTRAGESRNGGTSSYKPNLDVPGAKNESFFDENFVDIKPQGAAEISFGFKHTNNQNPRFSKKQQRRTQFDFDNKIQMSVTGKVGDKVALTVKYDTESQFEFDKEVKLEYEGDEDEIIKKIHVGDVSFPIPSALITGSQSLFGVHTELQFGKLYVNSVFSRQQGEFSTIKVQGGAQVEDFSIRADNYDKNKHFFLGHYFRNNYEKSFATIPEISSGIQIRKVEIWVTQTSVGKEDARNILAVTDLGDEYVLGPDGKKYALPSNGKLYKELKNISGIRNINNISSLLFGKLEQGREYEKIEQAVLLKPNEYDINNKLGYISLRSAINPAKILAIAYEYEYQGQVYQVGEFTSDGVEHPDVLIVKMLKGSNMNPTYNNWDLMMKNVYALGGYKITNDDFTLNILYEDDRTGTPIPYIPDGNIKGKNLLSVMNLDTITNDNLPYADGIFDFVEGYTINSSRGLLYFPVLEPFGSHLQNKIGNATIAQKYVYTQLYDSTQSAARQVAEKNKFIIQGKYKSAVRSEIPLNSTQVEKNSVTVIAGGRTLVEGVDYTVDYMGGTVKIINEGLLQSGTDITIKAESNPLFSMKTKNLMGTRFDYRYNQNINFGATIMRLSEKPAVQKVGFDDYPISNTIWGVDANYSTKSILLTSLVDKYVPFVKTKEVSQINLSGEFAQLIPGQSKFISDAVELDNFESTEGRIYLREPTSWKIASTPQLQKQMFPEAYLVNDIATNFNKAHITWYNINTTFYQLRNSPVSKDVQEQNFSRAVYQSDLFPNRDLTSVEDIPMTILNIAYYPYERGQNNYDTKGKPGISAGLNSQGYLNNPQSRWSGIMQSLTTTDFEESNVEYIEFWLMDPFVDDTAAAHTGGDFYVNLGRISEDVLRDGRKSAENGMLPDPTRYDQTVWGRVPNYSIVETGFSNDVQRVIQDVGLDGLNDDAERNFFASYLQDVKEIVVEESVFERFYNDPSADNYSSYLDNRGVNSDVVWMYKYFSGYDGNTPEASTQGVSSYKPDIEDLNNDNTLQETEAYYQYHISLRPQDLVVGKNFIVDKIVETNKQNNKTTYTNWYQIKIPIQSEDKQRIGDISDFRDIQSMRMFLRGFNDSIVLRIAEFALVYSSWRRYSKPLYESGEYDLFNDSEFDISVVNIEENASRSPVNYVLPPGVDRVIDPNSQSIKALNETALSLKVVDLEDGNSKAVYKQFNKDLRQFGTIEMFVHAEELDDAAYNLEDGELCAFIRVGSDFTENYYEYEVPLTLTSPGKYNKDSEFDRLLVWPEENMISLELAVFKELKLERDKMIADGIISDLQTYHVYSIAHGKNRVSIKGKPNIGNVRTIMIGVRNKKKTAKNPLDDGRKKSGIVWFNELRLTDIDDQSGWAAIASARIALADFATLSVSGKTSKPGFGGIDQKVFERSQEDLYQYDVASNIALNKFFPEAWSISLPFYVDFSEIYIMPQYDPTNPDILLSQSLDNMTSKHQRDSLLRITRDFTQRFSYNFTNVRINKQSEKQLPWNISNFSTSFAFNRFYSYDIDYAKNYNHQYKAAFNYMYNLRPKNYTPFKSSSNAFIKDINFFLLPTTVSFKNEWDRTYKEQQRRNLSAYGNLPVTASKKFLWLRTYDLNYALSKNLKFTYSALNQSRINEPYGVIDKSNEDVWQEYRREVYRNMETYGENMSFSQKTTLSYQLPFNRIKPLDWITSNYKYSGSYDWQLGAEIRNQDNFGNTITNSNTQSLDNTFNFTRLYNKSKYLNDVNKRMKSKGTNQTKKKETVKYNQENITLQANTPYVINHKLKTEDVRVSMLDNKGQVVMGTTKVLSPNQTEFTPNKDVENAKVTVTGKRDIVETAFTKIMDQVVTVLMMTKTMSVNYTQSEGTYIPGYKYGTQNFGLYKPFGPTATPGWPYVLGMIPTNIDSYLQTTEWLVDNPLISEKYKRTYSNQLRVQTSLEPIKSMRITLNADRSFSKNETRYLQGDAQQNKNNALIGGNFTMSYNTIATSFNSDKAYEQFKENRVIIANRLIEKNIGQEYEVDPISGYPVLYKETSQDVLIPAFLSAYSGQNPNDVYLNDYFVPMFSSFKDFVRTLNWRLSYNGLSKVAYVKDYFKSININHAYTSNYNLGAYETFTAETVFEDDFFVDRVDGALYLSPQYNVSNISISERFNPIIGVDAKLVNNMTAKFEVRSNRNVSLSFRNTEISETAGLEYVVGGGYVFKNFKVNINTANGKQSYENDLNIRMDLSIRKNQTIRRNIVEDITRKISGNNMYSLKTYADYMLNERFTIRLYLDYSMNKPLTNGYKTSSLNGGVNLRFSLM